MSPDQTSTHTRGPGRPTAPIALAHGAGQARPHLSSQRVELSEDFASRLRQACRVVSDDPATVAEASRDWWPQAMIWATDGDVAGLGHLVARPENTDEVAAVMSTCNEAGVPVTAAGGRSGVCGASVPVFGGVVLDLCGLDAIVDVDRESMVVDVQPGCFGDRFEAELRENGLTAGHWPQSLALSTVGGWIACRGAGQLSTRYGKIEDMVVGLDVVLADGTQVTTGGAPRAAVGPDLTQLFVGSEGTLGIVVGARIRLHPVPAAERRAAYTFASFAEGMQACRRILQRGATPAVLRLYDPAEAQRSYQTGERAALLVLDEADPGLADATMDIVDQEVVGRGSGEPADVGLVGQWLDHRNEVSALEALISKGYVVDTMEVAGSWSRLGAIYDATLAAIGSVPGALAASAHLSHSYTDGACLYFTFAGKPERSGRDHFYERVWDAGQSAVLDAGGALSHHHGVGLNRSRFVADALGAGFEVLAAAKRSLDPRGILNPAKLGLPSHFGEPGWP